MSTTNQKTSELETTLSEEIRIATLDGNEACAHVAYRVNEVCAIYPITPSSPMAEHADEWTVGGLTNIWGNKPDVVEMQSEGGAAGAVHGSLQAGALTTTFTASQGLMLMIPNMYKIAGELTSTVFHVAARSLAAQALSIFGDHSDVMAVRSTGFAMLASANVQEAHDQALISQVATLESRLPFLHFFDGFRTSHEVAKITLLSDAQIRSMIDDQKVREHRERSLNPDNPFIRGTAQNPDVYFQARETVNSFYQKTPVIVQNVMDRFAELTGRHYHNVEYFGAKDAEYLIIIMASGSETAIETAEILANSGHKVGVIRIRLYRPFPTDQFVASLPSTVKKIAVLDRTKEPGAVGEPLYQDVSSCLADAYGRGLLTSLPRIFGGRYGLSSKEFTPGMVAGVYDELKKNQPKHSFTVGINDDVTGLSIEYDPNFSLNHGNTKHCLFYGLGADGTVGANKNSIKIIGENTPMFAQGYFVYDSKKSGSKTISHLRFGDNEIRAPYLIRHAGFVACHRFDFLSETDMLEHAVDGATFLLNSPYGPDEVWDHLPSEVQQDIRSKKLNFWVIDATNVARNSGMGRRINTIMQTCFFALSEVFPKSEAIGLIKGAIEKSYKRKGQDVVDKNFKAVDNAIEHMHQVQIPLQDPLATAPRPPIVPAHAPDFVRDVTAVMMGGHGDDLPVSALPVDGTYPSATTQWEKRNIADEIPVWEPDLCIQCGNCSFVCPHAVIRAKFYHKNNLEGQPESFLSAPVNSRGFPETRYTLQIYAEDCTGCSLCVHACPVESPDNPGFKAINMHDKLPVIESTKTNLQFFEELPLNERADIDFSSVRGAQFLEPLFEFSGACAGCGETPYIRLLTQLFGDRLMVANATGCSSIYGGNLPTTPWAVNEEGKGPAWSNSLFEDNAEFGLGMRVSADKHEALARQLLGTMERELGGDFVMSLLDAPQVLETDIRRQRIRVMALKNRLRDIGSEQAKNLLSVVDHLIRRTVWLVGGDGWAYDIGSGGLDHVLSTGRNVNVLVLDTEVYSNTGGQMSKATPTAATAKFAVGGKRVGKKDLALQAISYGNVYVAQIAMGANPQQSLLAMREAEAYDGPSIILAYSPCIAHGFDLKEGLTQQDMAVASGYWPLLRYNPMLRKADCNPFVLDSPRPTIALKDYAYREMRYKVLQQTNPKEAEHLMNVAQKLVNLRWETYEDMAVKEASGFQPVI